LKLTNNRLLFLKQLAPAKPPELSQ